MPRVRAPAHLRQPRRAFVNLALPLGILQRKHLHFIWNLFSNRNSSLIKN
jgi:hypothetical protein